MESLREHYARTLRHWVANLEAHWDDAVAEVGRGPGPDLAALHGGIGRRASRPTASRSTRSSAT